MLRKEFPGAHDGRRDIPSPPIASDIQCRYQSQRCLQRRFCTSRASRAATCAASVYGCLILSLAYWRHISELPRPQQAPGSVTSSTDRPTTCHPAPRPHTLLVVVPFTAKDAGLLELVVGRLWGRFWPCQSTPLPTTRPDLTFAFSGNISAPVHAALRARLVALMARRAPRECFRRVRLESAHLSGRSDLYDKRRGAVDWTVGPNMLFRHSFERAARAGYRYMVQLEPDVAPLRPLWPSSHAQAPLEDGAALMSGL